MKPKLNMNYLANLFSVDKWLLKAFIDYWLYLFEAKLSYAIYMIPANFKILYARSSIILLFAIVTMLQIFSFPGQFAHMRRVGSIELLFEIWLTLLLAIWLFTAQFALLCLWKIVGQISLNSIYSNSALKWLDRLVQAFKYALITAITVFISIALQADDPGAPVMLMALTLFISTLFIATSLLRDQLRSKSD